MIEYTVDMFDKTKVEQTNKDLFMRKETVTFQLNVFEKYFNDYKHGNFSELIKFERLKKGNNKLLPNAVVLSQMKTISIDDSAKEFIENIKKLQIELNVLNKQIDILFSRFDIMFSFSEMNLKKYMFLFNRYFEEKEHIENVMYAIFDMEFLDIYMFDSVKKTKNIPILNLLVEKCPLDWKDFFRILIAELHYIFKCVDFEDGSELQSFKDANKIKRTERKNNINYLSKLLINRTQLNTQLGSDDEVDRAFKSKVDFSLSRIDRHKEILDIAEQSDLGNKHAGKVPFAAKRLKNNQGMG